MIYRYTVLVLIALLLNACATTSTVPRDSELSQNEKAANLNIQLGIGYLRQNNLQQADIKLRRAVNQAPDMALAHWSYALLQERLGEYKSAESHFERALQLDPKDARAHNNYGTFLCTRGRYKDAQEQFKLAVSNPLYRYPESAYTNAGVCAKKVANLAEAENYFRLALKKNSKYPSALYQMANLSFEQRQFLQARAYLQRYTEVARETPGILWLGYQIENSLGNMPAARQYALNLKTQFPESRETVKLKESQRNDF